MLEGEGGQEGGKRGGRGRRRWRNKGVRGRVLCRGRYGGARPRVVFEAVNREEEGEKERRGRRRRRI